MPADPRFSLADDHAELVIMSGAQIACQRSSERDERASCDSPSQAVIVKGSEADVVRHFLGCRAAARDAGRGERILDLDLGGGS